MMLMTSCDTLQVTTHSGYDIERHSYNYGSIDMLYQSNPYYFYNNFYVDSYGNHLYLYNHPYYIQYRNDYNRIHHTYPKSYYNTKHVHPPKKIKRNNSNQNYNTRTRTHTLPERNINHTQSHNSTRRYETRRSNVNLKNNEVHRSTQKRKH